VGGFEIIGLKDKRVVVIIQARMGSSRLPGKVLKEVLDKPLLGYLVERIKRSNLINDIVVATTRKELDDVIVDYCTTNKINYYRGSENDVLSRYYEASLEFNADFVVRICSDSPLVDPCLVDEMIEEYFTKVPPPDYFSNTINQSYPVGMNIEIFSQSALESAYFNGTKLFEREHVTPYIYMHPEIFNICQKHINPNLSHLRLTVDQQEDFNVIKLILEHLYTKIPRFTLMNIVDLFGTNPELFSINAHVRQIKITDLKGS
jgi:spore coat polysaccharide biosynthesis protein SpsF